MPPAPEGVVAPDAVAERDGMRTLWRLVERKQAREEAAMEERLAQLPPEEQARIRGRERRLDYIMYAIAAVLFGGIALLCIASAIIERLS